MKRSYTLRSPRTTAAFFGRSLFSEQGKGGSSSHLQEIASPSTPHPAGPVDWYIFRLLSRLSLPSPICLSLLFRILAAKFESTLKCSQDLATFRDTPPTQPSPCRPRTSPPSPSSSRRTRVREYRLAFLDPTRLDLTMPFRRARPHSREQLPLPEEARAPHRPQGRLHPRACHPVPRRLGGRCRQPPGQPRLPRSVQLGARPLQGRPETPPLRQPLHVRKNPTTRRRGRRKERARRLTKRKQSQVPRLRADLQECPHRPDDRRWQGWCRLRPQGQV